jgi:hypothetical protein
VVGFGGRGCSCCCRSLKACQGRFPKHVSQYTQRVLNPRLTRSLEGFGTFFRNDLAVLLPSCLLSGFECCILRS